MGLKTLRLGPRKRLTAFIMTLAVVAMYAVFRIATDRPSAEMGPVPERTESVATTSVNPLALPPSASSGQALAKGEIQRGSATTTVQTNATVIRVVDGDTFEAALDAEPGEWKIRLLGVDTPETVDPRKPVQCMGKEASDFAKQMLDGKRVRLDADPQADERDKYGRLLRNVLLEDGTDVNALLVRAGYAHAYLSFPLTPARKVELRDLQEQAKADSVGLWDPAVCP